jgi:protein-tyrosine-phosphatase
VTETFTVLFVCSANQCRSAMAEAIADDELARLAGAGKVGLEFVSAGTHALAGSPATNGTIAVLRDRGIDLARHRSRELDAGVLAGADLVLAMSAEHTGTILAWERSASRRTFTLAAFARAVERAGRSAESADERVDLANEHLQELDADDVADPVGQGEEAYQACVERIDGLVRPLVRALAKAAQPSSAR